MPRVLLLNSDCSPLQFINEVRAIKLLMKGRAEVITVSDSPSFWDYNYKSVSTTMRIPATIKLNTRVVVKQTSVRFKRKIMFNRDDWSCQYCNKKLTYNSITVDHVLPKCRGGQTTWKNCVVCCKQCNRNKGARLPQEANMKLLKQPSEPRIVHFWNLNDKNDWHKDWAVFVTL